MTGFALVLLVILGAVLVPRWLQRYAVRHRGADPALVIVPPRRYVDADGRSGPRPVGRVVNQR